MQSMKPNAYLRSAHMHTWFRELSTA